MNGNTFLIRILVKEKENRFYHRDGVPFKWFFIYVGVSVNMLFYVLCLLIYVSLLYGHVCETYEFK